jgi:branched-subunit amino acid ABC-type transport system permease component
VVLVIPTVAIAGALIIGVAQEISVPLIGSDYKLAVALLIMISAVIIPSPRFI